jgi:hypothetical protein
MFCSVAFADFLWAKFIPSAALGRAKARTTAHWAALMTLPGVVTILNVSHDPRLIAFSFVGAWVGTYLTLRFGPEK